MMTDIPVFNSFIVYNLYIMGYIPRFQVKVSESEKLTAQGDDLLDDQFMKFISIDAIDPQ